MEGDTLSSLLMWLLIEVNSETSKEKAVEPATPEEGVRVLLIQMPPMRAPAEQEEHT